MSVLFIPIIVIPRSQIITPEKCFRASSITRFPSELSEILEYLNYFLENLQLLETHTYLVKILLERMALLHSYNNSNFVA
jgi:hypothetical protein